MAEAPPPHRSGQTCDVAVLSGRPGIGLVCLTPTFSRPPWAPTTGELEQSCVGLGLNPADPLGPVGDRESTEVLADWPPSEDHTRKVERMAREDR